MKLKMGFQSNMVLLLTAVTLNLTEQVGELVKVDFARVAVLAVMSSLTVSPQLFSTLGHGASIEKESNRQ